MALQSQGTGAGGAVNPGGFEFGIVGFQWPEPGAKSVTFFLDGTAMVCDQWGRPIRGSVIEGEQGQRQEVWFAVTPPPADVEELESPATKRTRGKFSSHAKVVEALKAEGIDWKRLVRAGWPQLPYEELQEAYGDGDDGWGNSLPVTKAADLKSIRDKKLRGDALKVRREADEARAAESVEEVA